MSTRADSKTGESRITESSAAEFAAYQERLDQIATSNVMVGPATGVTFPAQYAAIRDPPHVKRMRYYNQMKTVYGDATAGQPQVVMSFNDEDVRAMQEKERMSAQVDFDTWIAENYKPWSNPADTQWLQTVYPAFFEARLKENETMAALKAQWTAMLITGPKSKEDLYLMFRVQRDPDLAKRIGANMEPGKGAAAAAAPSLINSGRWRRIFHAAEAAGATANAAVPANGTGYVPSKDHPVQLPGMFPK